MSAAGFLLALVEEQLDVRVRGLLHSNQALSGPLFQFAQYRFWQDVMRSVCSAVRSNSPRPSRFRNADLPQRAYIRRLPYTSLGLECKMSCKLSPRQNLTLELSGGGRQPGVCVFCSSCLPDRGLPNLVNTDAAAGWISRKL